MKAKNEAVFWAVFFVFLLFVIPLIYWGLWHLSIGLVWFFAGLFFIGIIVLIGVGLYKVMV